MESQAQYEARERAEFRRAADHPQDGMTRAEKMEAKAEWLDDLQTDPTLIGERIGWMLSGTYSFGSMKAAQEVAVNRRMNRQAWMVQTIGAIEWQVPADVTRRMWNKLTKAQRNALTLAVMQALRNHEEDADTAA